MPTNILRQSSRTPARDGERRTSDPSRVIEVRASGHVIPARLTVSPTADRIWAALPIRSSVSPWGAAVLIETPVESGRERCARLLGVLSDIYFEPATDRLIICWGATPIARHGELRLPGPCNRVAIALSDPAVLAGAAPGSRVDIVRV